ncbi:hypothetical protein LEN26_017149 [Aphanomyces euteiches]|nr:hypothetical protein LEN26_017149 [Aphanomyces euteiches]KAH9103750.1 hypothetical protein AeMF1_019986 [Aphanomyces euteiches]KAH9186186.1 hypothetical protein AeNC1_011841 [Aphanomyces euteiches]
MKFLAAVVTAVAATGTQQVIFDSYAPASVGSFGTPISAEQGIAVQFRSLDLCGVPMTLDYVNFTVSTENIDNNSTWLQVDLCPAVNGLPNCTANTHEVQRFPLTTVAKRIQYQWIPNYTVVLQPSTRYWFVVLSNAEKINHAAIWMDGLKRFTKENDPNDDVLSAFTLSDAGDWAADPPTNNRTVPSMQVVASSN